MKAYIFPGQGSQFVGMGKDLFENSSLAREYFKFADDIIDFKISELMFSGTEEDLRQTKVTQPAIFIHSVIAALDMGSVFQPSMVAGHSLGEFSALVANKTLAFDDALRLVIERANAMQAACEAKPSTMAAVLGLADDVVEEVCAGINEIVVPANYNCPGQIVISGTVEGVNQACDKLKEAGAKRAILLNVSGAFHSPLMEPARERLARAIEGTTFSKPICPVYQNCDAMPHSEPDEIRENLIKQLTAPVRWTQSVERMLADGAESFAELGPGKVLQGLVKKINREAVIETL